ncbi:Chromosome partition protein Smc [Carpediemonas membranifera]|uniref:Chromosome partition protein Smc n=1 Tax=Carpediemonas membranifera TaxID=201153 RepID=A0A8J6E209_9EUKA|nr:Chromosome partition protein Smc [Carpediemonas membranifera]|eukprot:KAG9397029.1 Chromosome partition protein Smc [Carpediemonas membranifera]
MPPEAQSEASGLSLAESQPQTAFQRAVAFLQKNNPDASSARWVVAIMKGIHKKLGEFPHGVAKDEISLMLNFLISLCHNEFSSPLTIDALHLLKNFIDTDKTVRQALVPSRALFGPTGMNLEEHFEAVDPQIKHSAIQLAIVCLQRLPGINPWMVADSDHAMLSLLIAERVSDSKTTPQSIEHRLNCLEAQTTSQGGELQRDVSRMEPVEDKITNMTQEIAELKQTVRTLTQALRISEGTVKAHGTEIRTLEMAVQSHTGTIKRLSTRPTAPEKPTATNEDAGLKERVDAIAVELEGMGVNIQQAIQGVDTLDTRIADNYAEMKELTTKTARTEDVDKKVEEVKILVRNLDNRLKDVAKATRNAMKGQTGATPLPALLSAHDGPANLSGADEDDLAARMTAVESGVTQLMTANKTTLQTAEEVQKEFVLFQSSTLSTIDYLKENTRAQGDLLQRLRMKPSGGTGGDGKASRAHAAEIAAIKAELGTMHQDHQALRDAITATQQTARVAALEAEGAAKEHAKRRNLQDIELRRLRSTTETNTGTVMTLESKLSLFEHRLGEMGTALEAAAERGNRALAECTAVSSTATKNELAVRSLGAASRHATDRITALGVRQSETDAVVTGLQSTVQSVVTDFEQTARELRSADSATKEQLGAATDRMADLRSNVAVLTGRAEQGESRLASAEDGMRAIRETVDSTVTQHGQAIQANGATLTRLERRVDSTDHAVQGLQSDMADISTSTTTQANTVKSMNARLGSQSSDVEALLSTTQRFTDDMSRLRSTVAVHDRMISDRGSAGDDGQETRITQLERAVDTLHESVRGVEKTVQQESLNSSMARARPAEDAADELFNLTRGLPSKADITELRTKLERLTDRVHTTESGAKDVDKTLTSHASSIAVTRSMVTGLARAIAEATDADNRDIDVEYLMDGDYDTSASPVDIVRSATVAVAHMATVLNVTNKRVDSLAGDVHDQAVAVTAVSDSLVQARAELGCLADVSRTHTAELTTLKDASRRQGHTVAQAVNYQQTKQVQLAETAQQNIAKLSHSDVTLAQKTEILRWTLGKLQFLPVETYSAIVIQAAEIVRINAQFFQSHPQPAQELQAVVYAFLGVVLQQADPSIEVVVAIVSSMAILELPTDLVHCAHADLVIEKLVDYALGTIPHRELQLAAIQGLTSASRDMPALNKIAAHPQLTEHLVDTIARPMDGSAETLLASLKLLRVMAKLPSAAATVTRPHIIPRMVSLLDMPDPAVVEGTLLLIKAVSQHGDRPGEAIMRLDGISKMVLLMNDPQKSVSNAATVALRSLAASSITMQKHLAQQGVLDQLNLRYPVFGRTPGQANPSAPPTPRTLSTPYQFSRRVGSSVSIAPPPATAQARVRPTSTPLTVGGRHD